MTSRGIHRDDIDSLARRHDGLTVVCAVLVNTQPLTIKDNTGTREIQALPEGTVVSVGDVCLLLFDCSDDVFVCKRVTVVPPVLVPLYLDQLKSYREKYPTV